MRCPDCGGRRYRRNAGNRRRRNPDRIAKIAIEILMDPEKVWYDKETAAKVLVNAQELGANPSDAIRALSKAAGHEHWAVRLEAVKALGAILNDVSRAANEEMMAAAWKRWGITEKVIPLLKWAAEGRLRPAGVTFDSPGIFRWDQYGERISEAAKKSLKDLQQYADASGLSFAFPLIYGTQGRELRRRPLAVELEPLQLPLFDALNVDPGSPSRSIPPSEFVIKQKFQKYDYDCGQACLDMLGYDGYALVPNRGLESSDLWAIDSIVPVLHEEGYDPEALDYTKPHIWGFATKSQMEEVTRLLAEWKKDNIQKNQDEVKRRYEALTEEEFGALDESDHHALWKEVDESIPELTIIDAIKAVGEGHWVVRYRDKIYCPKLGTMDAETYTKMAIGFVTQIFLVKGDEDPSP